METHYEGDLLQWRHIAMETHNDVESKRFKDNNPHLFSHRRQPTLVTHTLFKDFEDKCRKHLSLSVSSRMNSCLLKMRICGKWLCVRLRLYSVFVGVFLKMKMEDWF
ncbi:uncharacterized protein LOC105434875 isoform X1 [Cucumis sativus]|uniref:uncharacterized protein LOC105434875 isoform X1 n=1 Tax=Cucumis sativus TaxID=3659 RepID=UPI0005ED1B02|nr:uncharacterized protein LOC105434875 isoform X1 [Cucumis sativus]KAE8650583.1 hypothetical protein Csa_011556 [Cucumis sativus]